MLSTIRALMYHIVDNPVGRVLIERILKGIDTMFSKDLKVQRFLFKIDGKNFTCGFSHPDFYCDITIPKISFREASDSIIAERNDVPFYGYQYVKPDLKFSKLNRPFYVGLVHELIHLMHSLESKKTGTCFNKLTTESLVDFGGEDLWEFGDDLYTIWEVFSVKDQDLAYDYVSELTFRVYDYIPIRIFYEIEEDGGISLDCYCGENIDSLKEAIGINPLEKIKNILESVGLEKLITISV